MKKWALGIVMIIISCTPAMAAVNYDDKTHTLEISGITTSFQVVRAMNYLRKGDVLTVRLWGRGGEFYPGLQLGTSIRKAGATVIIPKGRECVSSCANADLGGIKIVLDGVLLFHSPYIRAMSAIDTPMKFAAKSGLGYIDNAAYFVMMGYPLQFMRLILKDTSHCRFLKFDDTKDLATMKGTVLGDIHGVQHDNRCYQVKR